MKTFKNQAAQGDMLARRVAKLPEGLKITLAENGHHILAHSETGHHHVVMERPGVEHFQDAMNLFRSFLVVPEGYEAPLVHLRDTHTHETLMFGPGIWEITRQREYDATAGWRAAAD